MRCSEDVLRGTAKNTKNSNNKTAFASKNSLPVGIRFFMIPILLQNLFLVRVLLSCTAEATWRVETYELGIRICNQECFEHVL